MLKFQGVVLLALAVFSMTVNAEVYKWKDKEGITRYSDTYPEGNIPYTPLKAKKPANGSVAASGSSQDANKAVGIKKEDKSTTPDASGKSAEQKEAQLKAKETACANAKDNLQKLKHGGIVYKENFKGEREYLDETSLKSETASAEKEVEASCK